MKKPIAKPLRFSVDRKSGRPFVRQLMDAIREAIECGYYRDGDVLPSLDDLSESAGVSIIVPREAISRLSEEGLVIPRRGVGSLVNVPTRKTPLGHVVVVTSEISDNFTVATVSGILRRELVKSGYMVSQVSVVGGPGVKPDFSQLDAILLGPASLVVLLTSRWEIAKHVGKTAVPMVVVESESFDGPSVIGRLRAEKCPIEDFVAHCVRAHVKSVVEVTFDRKCPMVVGALRAAGLSAREWHFVPCKNENPGYSAVEKRMFDAIYSLCASGKKLPDVFFFDDDIAARGALTAFLAAGVRIPDDARFAAITAYGRQPVFRLPLTRIEFHPERCGQNCAAYLLDLLRGDANAVCPLASAKYVIGGTFPENTALDDSSEYSI